LYGGTGLGLAIVKQLVEHQGGSLIVKSEEGKGSTFGFIMDFDKFCADTTIETESIVDTIEEVENVKILVAEDVPLNQLLIKIILEEFGFQCDIAENGKVAIQKLKENSYDIILMDILMPEMNGIEATDYIRNTMNSQIPIIALTADVTTVDVQKSKTVGMNDYISKPIDEKLLYDKIIKQLKKTLPKK
jgi:two-component system CheB/CheR fusion protein